MPLFNTAVRQTREGRQYRLEMVRLSLFLSLLSFGYGLMAKHQYIFIL